MFNIDDNPLDEDWIRSRRWDLPTDPAKFLRVIGGRSNLAAFLKRPAAIPMPVKLMEALGVQPEDRLAVLQSRTALIESRAYVAARDRVVDAHGNVHDEHTGEFTRKNALSDEQANAALNQIPNVHATLHDVDPDLLPDVVRAVSRFASEHPDVLAQHPVEVTSAYQKLKHEAIIFVPPIASTAGWTAAGLGGAQITLLLDYWSSAEMLNGSIKDQVRSGWQPAGGDTPIGMVEHELGHVLDISTGLAGRRSLADIPSQVGRHAEMSDAEHFADCYMASLKTPEAKWPLDVRSVVAFIDRERPVAARVVRYPGQPRDELGRFASDGDGGTVEELVDRQMAIQQADGTPNYAAYSMSRRGPHGDPVMWDIAEDRGLNGPPKVVSRDEMDVLVAGGAREMWRSTSLRSSHTEEFREGENFWGGGLYGTGIYAAYTRGYDPDLGQIGKPGAVVAAGYSDAGRGNASIVRLVLDPDAKVIGYTQAMREMSGYVRERGFTPDRFDSDPRSRAEYQIAYADVGRWAALQGYAAIDLPNYGYMSVLDRSALIVDSTDYSAYDITKAWDERRLRPPNPGLAAVRHVVDDDGRVHDDEGKFTFKGSMVPAVRDLDAVADILVDNATVSEPTVTALIEDIGRKTGLNPDAHFVRPNGEEHHTLGAKLKTLESTFSKFAHRLLENVKATMSETQTEMRDNLRYTFVSDPAVHDTKIREATDELIAAGCKPLVASNYWTFGDLGYVGVHENWQHPDGQVFEVQFHTQEGLEIKEVFSHDRYVEQRTLDRGSPRWNELQAEMDAEYADFRADNPGLGTDLHWIRDVFPEVKA